MFEPTIKDVAKMCGVGVSTVSRAINDHPDINPETKERIMDAIRESGYVPNDSARNLKRVDAKAIAVLVKGIANPFFTSMITVIEQECKKRHYSMELSHIEADEDEVDVAQKVVKEKRLRGDHISGRPVLPLGGKTEKTHSAICVQHSGIGPGAYQQETVFQHQCGRPEGKPENGGLSDTVRTYEDSDPCGGSDGGECRKAAPGRIL